MYQLKKIGKITKTTDNDMRSNIGTTRITLDVKYRKALKYLDRFSHAHVFYVYRRYGKSYLNKAIIKLDHCNVKTGVFETDSVIKTTDSEHIHFDCAELIDIKPYFPCEDSVNTKLHNQVLFDSISEVYKSVKDKNIYDYEINNQGVIRNVNGRTYIQLDEGYDKDSLQALATIEHCYIKVFWWFDRFDSDIYRQATECNPPYENAPRSGIFATRSPVRPNPIAMTIVRVLSADTEARRIYINDIESFDKTPCMGVSLYNPDTDLITECEVPQWLAHWPRWIKDSTVEKETSDIECHDSELRELLYVQTSNLQLAQVQQPVQPSTIIRSEALVVRGGCENNLKRINVSIPYNKITAVAGVSGSGKSSLVNDIIYAECRRRMEFLGHNRNMLQRPNAESITGCIPAVQIRQEAIRGNSLSTVGTYTSSYDYLRIIYAAAATRHCPDCGYEIIPLSREAIEEFLARQDKYTIEETEMSGGGAIHVRIPGHETLILQTTQKCYRCDRLLFELTPQTFSYIDADSRCPVCNGTGYVYDVSADNVIDNPDISLLDGASSFYGKLRSFIKNPNANWMKGQVFGLAGKLGEDLEKPWNELSEHFRDVLLNGSDEEVTFSYDNRSNGRTGQITRQVEGILQIIRRIADTNPDTKSIDKYMSKVKCRSCNGERLRKEGRMAVLNNIRYPQAADMSFMDILSFCDDLETVLTLQDKEKVNNPISSLRQISQSAIDLGLGYLKLSQETSTLSGGEGQRLKLLGAAVNHMTGILYVFDEPSKGLHPRDYGSVISMLNRLKAEGNTIIMVEHNEDMLKAADNVIEIGPGAGKAGGQLIGEGSMEAMLGHKGTQLAYYLNHENDARCPYPGRDTDKCSFVRLEHLNHRNLKDISVSFPVNALTCICGVSGSGKSSLMKGELYKRAGLEKCFSEVILVDQLPIGKSSKSAVATYIDIMSEIRGIFAQVPMAVEKGYDDRYFGFNSEAGQCPECKGEGRIKLKYLEDSYMQCPECKGRRYQRKVLEIRHRDKNIADVLYMTVDEAAVFWEEYPGIQRCLEGLKKVGLGYLLLGQGTSSLSGGEASRLKLAKELISRKKSNVLYLLDEPTTGLHFSDIDHLLALAAELIEAGNTIVAIEHNKQFLAASDWQIELGPGAGSLGGEVIREGSVSIYKCRKF